MMSIDIPNIVAASKLDPIYYKLMMNDYEFQHGQNHDLIVSHLLPSVKGKIIVPGDGLGRWAKVWKEEGYFSDVVSVPARHSAVKTESILDTLKKNSTEVQGTVILMFCSVFMGDEEWTILEKMLKGGIKLIVIDTRDHSFEKVGLRMVNNMVWESGYPELSLHAFPHDTVMHGENVKYSSILMGISNPVFHSNTKYAEYFRYMRPYFKPQGRGVIVYSTLLEYLKFKNENEQSYLACIGQFDPVIQSWSPVKILYTRTIYSAPLSFSRCVPKGFLKEEFSGHLYFVYPEAETTFVNFEGMTTNGASYDLKLQLLGVKKIKGFDWDLETLIFSLFSKHDKVGYTKDQLYAAAQYKGYVGSSYDLVEQVSVMDQITLDGDYYKWKEYTKVGFVPNTLESSFYFWVSRSCPNWTMKEAMEKCSAFGYDRGKARKLYAKEFEVPEGDYDAW